MQSSSLTLVRVGKSLRTPVPSILRTRSCLTQLSRRLTVLSLCLAASLFATYGGVTVAQTVGIQPPVTVSGAVKDNSGAAIAGVTISGLPGNPVTGADGNYTATVAYGFSGTVMPSKTGCTFSPASRVYSGVTVNQTGQGYTATVWKRLITGVVTNAVGMAVSGVGINVSPGHLRL